MTAPAAGGARRGGRMRVNLLAALVILQALCAVFFVGDVVADLRLTGLVPHTLFEAAVAVALIVGTFFCGLEMRRAIEAMRRSEQAVAAASGAFGALIEERFAGWSLTPAEAEVALFALKGFDMAEIAALRGAAPGTVRAQLARVYGKAGVTNRSQFVSLFIEDLLDTPLVGLPSAPDPTAPRAAGR
ncbi:helix-turn-helix transcriptional regulator [Psychromarinibacter sp. C21-152]|uniref:Helix-turn-helix transcriptional regulator n=1 Tax=Psychromarinibacter sediminicola TaxID=3033385 RepID=A0AAE3NRG4_9RHOB|nr:helix-turn-helix transcriptional regulator [Psychromarinibacter sediminicola]MDF0601086.1 helix-turn-helix transcriptional regulator [Psychromarinibacter sediminicola]